MTEPIVVITYQSRYFRITKQQASEIYKCLKNNTPQQVLIITPTNTLLRINDVYAIEVGWDNIHKAIRAHRRDWYCRGKVWHAKNDHCRGYCDFVKEVVVFNDLELVMPADSTDDKGLVHHGVYSTKHDWEVTSNYYSFGDLYKTTTMKYVHDAKNNTMKVVIT